MQTGQNSLSLVAEKFAPQTIQARISQPLSPPLSLGTSYSWHDPSFSDYQSFAKFMNLGVNIAGV